MIVKNNPIFFGLIFGTVASFTVPVLFALYVFDGTCGLGGWFGSHGCTLKEYLFLDKEGMYLFLLFWLRYVSWWATPVIIGLSVLVTCRYVTRK